jgi:lysophospholipase L1-like esterase
LIMGLQKRTLIAAAVAATAQAAYVNPFFVGATTGNMARLRSKRAAVKAGTDEMVVLIAANSNVAGAGAGTGGSFNYIGAKARSWPSQLAEKLSSTYGIPAQNAGFCSTNNIAANGVSYLQYDPRFTLNNVIEGGFGMLGGPATYKLSKTMPSSLVFNPGVVFNQVRVQVQGEIRNGNASISVDGTQVGTVTGQTGSFTASLVDSGWINCTRGAGVITLAQTRGTDGGNHQNDLPIATIEVRDTTLPAVRIIQAGYAGGTMANFALTTNPYSSANMIASMQPDVIIIAGGTINDSFSATSEASWRTSFGALLDKCVATPASTIWTSGLWLKSANGTVQAASEVLQVAGRDICTTRGLPILDMHERWKSGAYDTTTGKYFDEKHPTLLGYTDWADQSAGVLALA